MAQEVKPEPVCSSTVNCAATKLEKNPSKSRGSGSPFKCIGLGLTQQINSEKDEELTAGRRRIEELQALAASRQKEVGFECYAIVQRCILWLLNEVHEILFSRYSC